MNSSERIKKALLIIERRELVAEIAQINAAISYLLEGGKENYDLARSSNREDYDKTSEEILKSLRDRLEQRETRLSELFDE